MYQGIGIGAENIEGLHPGIRPGGMGTFLNDPPPWHSNSPLWSENGVDLIGYPALGPPELQMMSRAPTELPHAITEFSGPFNYSEKAGQDTVIYLLDTGLDKNHKVRFQPGYLLITSPPLPSSPLLGRVDGWLLKVYFEPQAGYPGSLLANKRTRWLQTTTLDPNVELYSYNQVDHVGHGEYSLPGFSLQNGL